MDSLKFSGINVVTWIIGSGLIVFTIGTLYTDFIKRPNIQIEIFEFPRSNTSISMDIWAYNNGMIPAHNITLTVETPNMTILELYPTDYEEDIRSVTSNKEHPEKGDIKIPRLSIQGKGISQNMTLAIPKSGIDHEIPLLGTILASYEEGDNLANINIYDSGISYSASNKLDVLWRSPFSNFIAIVIPIIGIVILIIPKLHKKMKRNRFLKIYCITKWMVEILDVKFLMTMRIINELMNYLMRLKSVTKTYWITPQIGILY